MVCASCKARYGEDPPVARKPVAAAVPTPEPAPEPEPAPRRRKPRARKPRTEPRPDRLRAALGELPGSFSTAMAARAAGLNQDKTLARLQDLERRGEVRRDGNRWTTEAPATDLTAALDRLQARTSNIRIVREKARVG